MGIFWKGHSNEIHKNRVNHNKKKRWRRNSAEKTTAVRSNKCSEESTKLWKQNKTKNMLWNLSVWAAPWNRSCIRRKNTFLLKATIPLYFTVDFVFALVCAMAFVHYANWCAAQRLALTLKVAWKGLWSVKRAIECKLHAAQRRDGKKHSKQWTGAELAKSIPDEKL